MFGQQGRKRPHQAVAKPERKPIKVGNEETKKENVPPFWQKIAKKEPDECETLDDETEEEKRERYEKQIEDGVLFQYPHKKIGEFCPGTVIVKDVGRLCWNQWLSDGLISFMINFLALKLLSSEFQSKIWIAPTQMFSKVVQKGIKIRNKKQEIWLFDKQSEANRTQKDQIILNDLFDDRLAKAGDPKVNYFTKKALIIPINHDSTHWMLALILNPGNMISYHNKVNSKKTCHIMVLDSLHDLETLMRKEHVEFVLKRWLAAKFLSMERSVDVYYGIAPSMTKVKNLPEQPNGFDCGPFLVDFLGEMFYKESRTGFFDMNFDKLDWEAVFPESKVGKNTRKFIFRSVLEMCAKNVRRQFKQHHYFRQFENLIDESAI